MHALHEVFHVVFLLAFFLSLGLAFISLLAPLLFEGDLKGVPKPRRSIPLALGAAAALGLDWLFHHLR
ncbi:MAG: hypothetical protein ABR507_12370 [Actinomycetota bacterium]|nr:hypothetical protein [Actinomycetota bacterium]